VDVRIGIADSTQIIEVDMGDDTDRDEMRAQVQAVLSGSTPVLMLVDRRGKELNVAAGRVAWIELGSADADRRIGFGA
jgi:hypothetical protein